MAKTAKLLETGAVAERLGVSSVWVRRLANDGVLQPTVKTSRGWRLFDAALVERFVKARAARRGVNRVV